MAIISIFSPIFILYQIIPAIFAILAGVFLIFTEKYRKEEIIHYRYLLLAGSLIIVSRIALLILIIFELPLISTSENTIGTIAFSFLVNALIQHFPILITFVACISYIAVVNKEHFGHLLLYVAFVGTIYAVLLLIMDLAIFYWILGYAPVVIALAVGLAAFITFIITFILMVIVGVKRINKYFAISGVCFLLEFFSVAIILLLFI